MVRAQGAQKIGPHHGRGAGSTVSLGQEPGLTRWDVSSAEIGYSRLITEEASPNACIDYLILHSHASKKGIKAAPLPVGRHLTGASGCDSSSPWDTVVGTPGLWYPQYQA
jgi:hypothetical protein